MRYFKKLVGDNCYLSPINPEDAEIYTKWLNDLEVTINTTIVRQMISLPAEEEMLEELSKEGHNFAIVELEDDELIGNCGLMKIDQVNRTAELGIVIGNKDYWNQGFGQEALDLLLDYGFNILNLNNIMLRVFEFNKRAVSCYQSCGFKEIGRRREARIIGGEKHDVIYMDLLASEFEGGVINELIDK
jgi:RimJ/RimL family protein N-acetyltransferase